MTKIAIVFREAASAECRVAGLPAAARAVRAAIEQTQGPIFQCLIFAGTDWAPSAECQMESARLAGRVPIAFTALLPLSSDIRAIDGEALIVASARVPCPATDAGAWTRAADDDLRERLAALKFAGRDIVASTGKPGDGIVSRYVNRPISRSISNALLAIPGVTPFHATVGTAILGIAMALCLIFGGTTGLIFGAILFQAASIFDGVDGEIARATFRTSARGAMLDSLIDAVTNLAFIAGLAINLGRSGDRSAATAGVAGLVMLAFGLFLIGRRARALGQPVNFDVIKVHFRKRKSAVMEWLIWFTMRDFFAAASALLILIGGAREALFAFGIVAAIWLTVVMNVLVRTHPARLTMRVNRSAVSR